MAFMSAYSSVCVFTSSVTREFANREQKLNRTGVLRVFTNTLVLRNLKPQFTHRTKPICLNETTRKPLFPFMRDTLRVLPVFMHYCRLLAFLSCLDSTVTHTSSVSCLSVPLSVPIVPSVSTVSPDTIDSTVSAPSSVLRCSSLRCPTSSRYSYNFQ